MSSVFDLFILESSGASKIIHKERIQELWSGYGEILRVHVSGEKASSIIVKSIDYSKMHEHPRGWKSEYSHTRKVKSYQVEQQWYQHYATRCSVHCRVPILLGSMTTEKNQTLIALEDLNGTGFSERKSKLSNRELLACVRWLAHFHATFLEENVKGLWITGTYWHLGTRSEEYASMEVGELKQNAVALDKALNEAKYHTLVHGDAKVANFCFHSSLDAVAAVDFQYVGNGCGIKDLIYFMGSCLSEKECEEKESVLLNYYFHELKEALGSLNKKCDFIQLEEEWRQLYPIAWADFVRFLQGWMPDHHKINKYSNRMVKQAIEQIRMNAT